MLEQKQNENNLQYAERLANTLDIPNDLREKVITNLVRKLSDRQLLRQIEQGKMRVVKNGSTYQFSMRPSE